MVLFMKSLSFFCNLCYIISEGAKMENILKKYLNDNFSVDICDSTDEQIYIALLNYIKQEAVMRQNDVEKTGKKLYYISSEFLIGKLLSNNLINLEVYDDVKKLLIENGKDIKKIEELECEPSLGNGGLGRLAACFLDSIATLGLNGDGISLLYHFGLFEQKHVDNMQYEVPNKWITDKSFLNETDKEYKVSYKDFDVMAKLYQVDVLGYKKNINKLNLFDIKTVDESIVSDGIGFDKVDIKKNLTLFLYPDDSDVAGHMLRIYQQYFMVSAGAQLIIDEVLKKGDLENLDQYAVIQINDTHPTLVIPELIRILVSHGIEFDRAVELVTNTCAYTNHTILAEALEKWPLDYLQAISPEITDIIMKLDHKISNKFKDKSLQIIDEDNRVHMAHICIHFSQSTNGVAQLHTDILINNELKPFADLYPHRFNNKTNGITFRRWLMHANPELTDLIESYIGDGFKVDASELKKLEAYVDDSVLLTKLQEIKNLKKLELKDYIMQKENIVINENSIFDIQVKRMHEYKRQQMNALYIINKYIEIKNGNIPKVPITFIFGGKAAPAYTIAKDIIHLILCLQELISNDEVVSPHLQVLFVENYNVSVGEKLFPACDVSEQISLASKEASGTGNMKFMLNGAVTLGTLDGANVEIADLVGDDNIFIFGKKSQEIINLYETEKYDAKFIYENESKIKAVVDFIISDEIITIGNSESLNRLHNELINKDWFMTLIDLIEYIEVKEKCFDAYNDRIAWTKKSLINTACAGYFSSDRTIEQYEKDIWHLKGSK